MVAPFNDGDAPLIEIDLSCEVIGPTNEDGDGIPEKAIPVKARFDPLTLSPTTFLLDFLLGYSWSFSLVAFCSNQSIPPPESLPIELLVIWLVELIGFELLLVLL